MGDVCVTTFGCAEWLRHHGYTWEGELVFHDVTPRPPLIAEIQAKVAARFGIPELEMTSARRSDDVVRPRQVAMFLSRELTRHSMPMIGRRFGNRDHTTVIHACRQVKKLCAIDGELAANVDALRAELTA